MANSPERNADLRHRTRRQLIMHLEDEERGGSESLMKEVWEECYDAEDRDVVGQELRRLIDLVDTHTPDHCDEECR